MTTARCEPPEGWRQYSGYHWLMHADNKLIAHWLWDTVHKRGHWSINVRPRDAAGAGAEGYRYLFPVAPPAVVRGLVEALEGLLVGCEYRPGGYSFAFGDDVPAGWGTKTIPTDAALDAARSALAAAKEAGP